MATTNDSMEENVGEILVAWQKYKANGSDELDLREGDVVELLDTEDPSRSSKRIKLDPELDSLANKSSLLDNTAARHKLSVKPSRKHASSRYSPTRNNLNTRWLVKQINGKKAQGWVPCNVLQSSDEPTPGTGLPGDAAFRRQAVVKELVETENEFVKDLDFVVQEYLIRTEATKVPKVIKDNLELVFGGLVEIANFHRTVLMEGVKYYANEPNLLGKAFLRLERDFDKHVNYCTDEPTAQAFLESCDIAREYFDDLSQRLGDDKTLSEHLKLPIQRINDYQLLLKELVRYSECLEEDCVNLQKALELMLSVPHRAQDDKFTSNIEGYRGSIHKLGRLISHDWFSATFGNTTKERYLFLFKARILITKVRRISEDRSIFQLKDIIRLPQIEIKDHPNNRTFELIDKVGGHSLILASHRDFVKELWLKEIREFASDVEEQTEDLVLSEATSTLASEAVPPEFKAYVPPQATDAQKQLAAALQSGIKKVSEVPKTQVSKLSETNQNQIDENEKSTSYQTTNDQKGAQESETLQVLTNSERSETNEESLPRDGLNREVKPDPTGQSKPELKPEKEETKSTVEPSNRPLPNHVNQEETFKSTTKVTKEEAKVVETNRVVCIELNKEVNKTTSNESGSSSRSIEKAVREETVSSKELLSKVKTEAAQLPSKPNQEDLIELPTVSSTKVEPKVLPQTVDSKPVVKDSLESLTTAVSKVEAQKVPEPLPDKVKVTSVEPEEQLLKPLPKKQEESQAVCQTLPTKEEKLPPNNKDIKETCILSKKSDNKENINVNLVQDKKAEDIKVTPLEQSKTNLTDKSKNSDSKRKDPTTDSKQSNQPALKKSKGERETKLEETKQKVVEEKVVEVGEEPNKLEKGDKEVQKESDKKSTDGAASSKKSPEEIPKRKTQETQKLPDENSETEEKAPKKLRFAEAPREVETPNNQTLNSTSSKNTQTQQNHSQPPKEEERREELRNFGERNPDEPPIPVPIPPPKPVKPHHNKIEVSVVETQIKGVNFGVQLSVEVDDEMSRRYSGKGGDSGSSNVANSGDGSVATTFTLNRRKSSGVEGRPVFKRTISGTNVEPGESAVFEVELAVATDSLTWLKDNKPLKHLKRIKTSKTEDGVCRLEINESEARDAGLYSAIAVNSISKSTCSAQLIVHELTEQERAERLVNDKPVFLVQLKDTELLEDTYLRFMVKVKGDPTPKIAFFKDDVQIKDNDERYQIVRESSGKGFYELVIPEVQHEDAGKYKCVASNKFGEATSEATVTVTDFKNIFGDLADDELLHPGEKPVFYWKKDGNIFEPEERFKVLLGDDEDSLALVFQHVRPEDAGLYTCVAQTSSGHISCSAELTVHGVLNQLLREPEKPQLVAENKEACANVGNSGMLELQVKGYPKPQIKWTHDGTPIEPSSKYKFLYEEDEENYTLVIKNVEPNDAGTYIASAENELGSDTVEMYLNVKAGPKIKSNCEDISQEASTIIRIPVEVEGLPKPTVTFLKEGQTIKKNERIKIVEEGEKHTLIIENCNIKDSGSYSVVVANEISQTSKFWSMDIYSPPKITKKLGSNKTVSLKEDITLSVKIESKPDAEVTWYKDEQEVSGSHYITKKEEDSYSLKISGTVTTDSARYKVKAKNIHGSAEDECRVDVKIAPKITKPLVDKTVVEKEKNVEFDVKVEAFPKPTIKWYFDEMEITESRTEFTRIESDDGSKLVIKEVSSDLSGKYKCKVVNELGETETSAKLTVNCKPRFIKHLKDTTIEEGATLHLEVEVDACPEPTVKWLRNGREVTTDARIKITRDSKRYEAYHLAVDLIKYEEQGDYEVVVTNSLGTVSSKSVVTVQTPPKILESNLNDKSQYESLDVAYVVKATSNPIPTAVWSVDGKPLTQDNRVKISDNGEEFKLEIKKLNKKDAGVIECKVSNLVGEAKTQAKLSIIPEGELRKPKIKDGLTDKTALKHKGAKLSAVIEGEPVPDATWYINNKEITPEQFEKYKIILDADDHDIENDIKECTFALSIPHSHQENTGKYKIKAKNKWGECESSAQLTIVYLPEIEGPKDIHVVPGESAEFSAKVIANPQAKISWMKDGKPLEKRSGVNIIDDNKNGVYKVTFDNVELADEGKYQVVAKNEIGETTSDTKLKAITEKPQFITGLADAEVEDGGEITVMVRADGIPKPEIRWFFNGKSLEEDAKHKIVSKSEAQITSTLSVLDYNKNDIGQYKAMAVNVVGEAETTSQILMVQRAPTFGKMLERAQEINEGEPLKLIVKVSGSPKPTVTWLKNGEPITGENVEITMLPDGTAKLYIDKVLPSDSGAYKVLIKNPNGETSSMCAVAVTPKPQRPKFLKCIKDVKAPEEQQIRLQAQVVGYPVPDIKWQKDGVTIRPSSSIHVEQHPDGTVALIVDSAKPENAGTYTLIATNKLGESENDAQVVIEKKSTKPEFITKLQPLTAVEGFPAKLEVKAKGFPAPQITWTRNGVEIVPDNQHIKIMDLPDGTSALFIDACDIRRDPMSYKAIATNEAGDTESSAILAVSPATKEGEPEEAPMFLHSMRDVVADEDQPLVIDVPFVGNPIPRVEWFKDEEPLEPSDRVLLTCDGKKVALQIDNCTPADAGKYGVKLTNALGSDASEGKATVHKVFSPPRFTQKFTDLQQLPGRDAKFSGKVSGVPTPEITWYKDGTAIKPNEKYRMKTDGDLCSLYINNCQASDAGLYRAFAVNKEGSDTCEAQFNTVDEITTPLKAEPPSFLKKIGDMDLYKGMTAKFTACITGFPEPKVEWFKNDKQLKPSSRIKMEVDQAGLLRLTVAKIDEDDLGKYSCKITNEHGSDICHATLQFDDIDARPRKPISDEYIEFDKHQKSGIPVPLSDPPIVSRMTDRHCTLSWKPSVPSYARPPVTYQLEMCELPHGDWFTARSGIRNCVCTVGNLEPFRDYRFRIRIENKYGISDPSPYATTYRQKLEPDPPRFNTHLPIGIPFHPDTSPYFPHDFDIERPLHDNMSQSPRFLRQEHPTQYGMKNQNTNLFWYVYGYPKPKMEYYFNDEPIPSGGRFDTSYTRNGQATLFINKMLDRDVGWYEAVATNEHGIARQRVRLEIAELPEFTKRPDIEYSMVRGKVRFEARISGRPYPDIKWYKDWKPVAESSRIKIRFIEPDLCILTIDDIILKDSGLYSVSARNAAGTISSSAMLYVDENDYQYKLHTYSPISTIRSKRKLYDEFYDFGDELGRGTQGITYHAVDRSNGYNYAAKVMHGRGDVRPFMYNELDMYNQLRHRRLVSLYDAYDSEDCLVFILELGGGGELVRDYLIRRDYYTETDIAGYIRQTLQGLQYMHEQGYGHMGLNIGDILLTHPGSSEIKITDFGLSRRITPGNLYPLLYGVPEYVCPEAVLGEGTGYGQDMWSIGIITYILLSGRSPFLGENDRETLYRIKDGTWTFDMDWWCNISVEARDFISKLLIYKPGDRMDVRAALRHPWLERIDRIYRDEYQISSRYLNDYYMLYRDWYNNASCRQWFRRRPLDGAYTHPSKMVYPPGEIYTPPPSPTPQRKHYSPIRTWEDQLPSRSPLNYEIGLIKSESHYQNGPDTYLLQLRDVSFPVRVREYMKVAANRGPGRSLVVSNENGFDWDTPVVRERRRFTDVMDEEIDDERKARINKYGVDNVASYSIRRLRRELGPRLDTYAEAEAMIESRQDGRLPFFREKPQITAMVEGKELDLTCFVVGDPSPTVQWFKNDAMVVESARVSIETDSEGRTHFKLLPALSFDVGMYRVVARNKIGQTVAWTRIVYGTVPDAPDSPTASQVSDTEILLTWKPPKYDGNSPVLCYSLQYKAADTTDWEWIQKVDNIDHEFYLISGLEPNKRYLFRLAANSAVGWSEQGVPSAVITTLTPDAPKIELSAAMRHLQQITDSGKPVEPEVKLRPDYSLESKPVDWQEGNPNDNYEYISEISRGQYSAVLKAVDRKSNKLVVAKLLDLSTETCDNVDGEFAALRSLRHERIAGLLEAYRTSTDVATFIMEKLQGADVLTYLASKHEYTEDMVATIVSQISDGLQYLHWRNLCHLDIQPDNVVMCGLRAVQIKLVDFGCAHRVTKLGTKVPMVGHPDYISPEVLNEEPAFPQSDIWSLGVLTYVMLSGALPFQGEDVNEIRQNISFVRYRFEYLYQELSQEGNRFIMMIFKRNPHKRPTAEECHENRWLLPTDSMIKKRDRAVFLGSRLREYCEKYHSEKSKQTTSSKVGRSLVKSHSIQEELLIAP